MTKRFLRLLWLLALAALPATQAVAQAADTQPIRLIVASAPGGSLDFLGRLIAQEAGKLLGTSIFVDNKTGTNSVIPLVEGARATPNGRNFLLTTTGPLVNNVVILPKLPYDPVKDFVPVVQIGRFPMALFVAADSPYKTVNDLVVAARAKPKAINFATAGPANATNLAAERLAESQQFQFTPVPYKSEALMMMAVVAGESDASITTIAGGIGLVKSGRLRVLAMFDNERFSVLPDVPTTAELGIANVESAGMPLIVAPTGTPREAIERMNKAVNQVLRQPDVIQKLKDTLTVPMGGTPEDVQKILKAEADRWHPTIKRLGLMQKE